MDFVRLPRSGWRLEPMTERTAHEVIGWRYPEPYAFYNLSLEVLEELLDGSYWVAMEESGRVAAFYCTGAAARVQGGFYAEPEGLDIGLGLRPDLTGQGLGGLFLMDILDHLARTVQATQFRLTVAAANERAIRLYERLGFRSARRFEGEIHGFLIMLAPVPHTANQEDQHGQRQENSAQPECLGQGQDPGDDQSYPGDTVGEIS